MMTRRTSQELKGRALARCRARRRIARDEQVPVCGRRKTDRLNLGLALLSYHALPGQSYSNGEIAIWCGCTESAIHAIERRALKKLRVALMFRDASLRVELLTELFNRREAARPVDRNALELPPLSL
jgi:hypothetical protein